MLMRSRLITSSCVVERRRCCRSSCSPCLGCVGWSTLQLRDPFRVTWLFCWKKAEESLEPLCLFWTIWKEKSRRSINNVESSVQKLKFLFLCSLLSWTNLFIENSTMFIKDFIDWLGSDWGRKYFCFPYRFWHYLAVVVYTMCTVVCPFWHCNTIFIYLSKELYILKICHGILENIKTHRNSWYVVG